MTRQNLRRLVLWIAPDDTLRALPLLFRESPICNTRSGVSSSSDGPRSVIEGHTFHGRDGVSALLELVLGEPESLKDWRVLDGAQVDVVVGTACREWVECPGVCQAGGEDREGLWVGSSTRVVWREH